MRRERQKLTSLLFSSRDRSYSLREAKNKRDVTFSKQWIHFLLSPLWFPTSTNLKRQTDREVVSLAFFFAVGKEIEERKQQTSGDATRTDAHINACLCEWIKKSAKTFLSHTKFGFGCSLLYLRVIFSKVKQWSVMPVVGNRTWRTSWGVGM